MFARPLSFVLLAAAACMLACTDGRESVVREDLVQRVGSQSGGALSLGRMVKTNGFEHEREGMKLYTVEWEATLNMHSDGWKAGWRDYQVLPAAPNAFAAAIEGMSVRRLLKGGNAVLQGRSQLQKADRGWRVLESEVTAFKINAPPEIATFVGTWYIANQDLVFRIEYDESRGLHDSVATIDREGKVSWVNTRPARLDGAALLVDYEEGSGSITKVSANELHVTNEDAFGKTSQRAVRVEGGNERILALARAVSTNSGVGEVPSNASTRLQPPARVVGAGGEEGSRSQIGKWTMPDDLAFLSQRRIREDEIGGLSRPELRRLRNFIYARHGRTFASQDLRQFFGSQPWYSADPRYSDSVLSSTELANAATIAKVENARP